MHAHQEFAAKDILDHIIDDMANAISQRPDEGPGHQDVRARVATAMMEDLGPRDAAQVMLAGHCVMFHAVLTDSFRDTLRGEMDTMRRGTRSNLVAMNKSFHMNLDRLDQYQTRAAKTANVPATVETIQAAPSLTPEPDARPAATPSAVAAPVLSAPASGGAPTSGAAVASASVAPVASASVAPVASAPVAPVASAPVAPVASAPVAPVASAPFATVASAPFVTVASAPFATVAFAPPAGIASAPVAAPQSRAPIGAAPPRPGHASAPPDTRNSDAQASTSDAGNRAMPTAPEPQATARALAVASAK